MVQYVHDGRFNENAMMNVVLNYKYLIVSLGIFWKILGIFWKIHANPLSQFFMKFLQQI